MMEDIILNAIAKHTGIPKENITKQTNKREIVWARQLVQYFMTIYTKYSLTEIGRRTANRDHSTVLYSCNKINGLMDVDPRVKKEILSLNKKLSGAYKNKVKKNVEETDVNKMIKDLRSQMTNINQKIQFNQIVKYLEVA